MKFSGTLSAPDFTRAVLWRLAAFFAATLLFPFLLLAIRSWTHCGIDTCGAVTVVAALFLKPIIYLVFCLSFVPILVRRLRDVALPTWYAGSILALMLADITAGMLFGASPWVGFVIGRPFGVAAPSMLANALVCMAALCAMPAPVPRTPATTVLKVLVMLMCLAAPIFAGLALSQFVGPMTGFDRHAFRSLQASPLLTPLYLVISIGLLSFGALAAESWLRANPRAKLTLGLALASLVGFLLAVLYATSILNSVAHLGTVTIVRGYGRSHLSFGQVLTLWKLVLAILLPVLMAFAWRGTTPREAR